MPSASTARLDALASSSAMPMPSQPIVTALVRASTAMSSSAAVAQDRQRDLPCSDASAMASRNCARNVIVSPFDGEDDVAGLEAGLVGRLAGVDRRGCAGGRPAARRCRRFRSGSARRRRPASRCASARCRRGRARIATSRFGRVPTAMKNCSQVVDRRGRPPTTMRSPGWMSGLRRRRIRGDRRRRPAADPR